MATLTITLPDETAQFLEEQARRGQISVDAYLDHAARDIGQTLAETFGVTDDTPE